MPYFCVVFILHEYSCLLVGRNITTATIIEGVTVGHMHNPGMALREESQACRMVDTFVKLFSSQVASTTTSRPIGSSET